LVGYAELNAPVRFSRFFIRDGVHPLALKSEAKLARRLVFDFILPQVTSDTVNTVNILVVVFWQGLVHDWQLK
jgi:hypothetical protein